MEGKADLYKLSEDMITLSGNLNENFSKPVSDAAFILEVLGDVVSIFSTIVGGLNAIAFLMEREEQREAEKAYLKRLEDKRNNEQRE